MKTYNRSILKGAVLAGAIAFCFNLNLKASANGHETIEITSVSDTGKMDKMKSKKPVMKKKAHQVKASKMESSKMADDKMGSKM